MTVLFVRAGRRGGSMFLCGQGDDGGTRRRRLDGERRRVAMAGANFQRVKWFLGRFHVWMW